MEKTDTDAGTDESHQSFRMMTDMVVNVRVGRAPQLAEQPMGETADSAPVALQPPSCASVAHGRRHCELASSLVDRVKDPLKSLDSCFLCSPRLDQPCCKPIRVMILESDPNSNGVSMR